MIRWHLDRHLKAKGWDNAYQLAHGAKLTYPVASRLLQGEAVERIDVATLEALAHAFNCSPWDLLEYKAVGRGR